jgi:carboxyl-terminal processing protease
VRAETRPKRNSGSSRGPWVLLSLALFLAGFAIGQEWPRPLATPTPVIMPTAAVMPTPVAVFSEAWSLLHEHYVDPAALDDQRLLAGALRGLADAVGDDGHTRYLTAEELAQHSEQLSGEYSGVGIEISEQDNTIVVRDVFADSPAARAGIQPGDVLVAVDGIPVSELGLDGVVQRVRGPEGTVVTLVIQQVGEASPLEVRLVRSKVRFSGVRWAVLPERVGLLRVSSFAAGTAEDARQGLSELAAAGARGVILDLRGNPGGLVDQAVDVAGLFLPPDTVVLRSRDRSGKETVYRTKPDAQPVTLPLVVLVNRETASAAEIVAGALQDHRRAVIIGERTFGTGTVLAEFRLRDGSALLIGTQVWVTPNGRVIWRTGIEPDITVAPAAEDVTIVPRRGEILPAEQIRSDSQLLAAWEYLLERDRACRSGEGEGCP